MWGHELQGERLPAAPSRTPHVDTSPTAVVCRDVPRAVARAQRDRVPVMDDAAPGFLDREGFPGTDSLARSTYRSSAAVGRLEIMSTVARRERHAIAGNQRST